MELDLPNGFGSLPSERSWAARPGRIMRVDDPTTKARLLVLLKDLEQQQLDLPK